MNLPLITVITPTTGNAHLDQAIQSVAEQRYSHIQHLIMVDGQSSEAMEILSRYSHYSHIDTVSLPYNIGRRSLGARGRGGGGEFFLGNPFNGEGFFLEKGVWIF
ncbi:hypothetical protein, partial [Avibacterium volantium]|uniref:hypothetical protein n=1 Tax=Avibacterium volantium TaxID=762 RepID=UPI003BF7D3EA